MRWMMISSDGDGCGIARRLVDEGGDVTVYIKNKKAVRDYDGLLRKTDKIITSPDMLYLFDANPGGKTADRLKAQGFPVLGSSVFAQQLEMDRHLALDLMKDAGIQTPPSQHFMDYDEGIQYTEAKGERLCYKSDNNKQNSYVSSCAEDMVEFLRSQKKEGEKADFELQDFVKGLEISSEIWMDGYDMSPPPNHTFEKKQLMNDDLGPSSGCTGNVCWACTETYCKICEAGIKKFIPMLRHHGYRGPIDLNTIVNDQGVWGLEFTSRFGFDSFPALMEAFTEPISDTLVKFCRGERVEKFPIRDKGFASALRVSGPPYPSDEFEAPAGIPIRELVRADRQHVYLYNVLMDPEGQLRSSGAFGAICVTTAFGDSISEAMGKSLEIANRMEFRNKQYRTDLGMVFEQSYAKFREILKTPEPPPKDTIYAVAGNGRGDSLPPEYRGPVSDETGRVVDAGVNVPPGGSY